MTLFTCKKYDFLIEKNLQNLSTYFVTRRERNKVYSPHYPKTRKIQAQSFLKLKSHFLRVAR